MITRTLKEKNNILSLARELYRAGEITLEQLHETYYINFIRKENK